jgi:hypothetical protein
MAKDKHDSRTGNLFLNKNAVNQQAFKQKKRDAGFVQKTLWVHKASFDQGLIDGANGLVTPGIEDESVTDFVSWKIGQMQGKEKADVSTPKAICQK